MKPDKRLLVVAGPTASGKSKLVFDWAEKHAIGIISADARQVYKYLDIVTGKDLPANWQLQFKTGQFPVWSNGQSLLAGYDLVEPGAEFSLAHYYDFFLSASQRFWARYQTVVLVGGSGFYLSGVLNPPDSLYVPPDLDWRTQADSWSLALLQQKFKQSFPRRWQQMNQSDQANPRRLIRAWEVERAKQAGQWRVPDIAWQRQVDISQLVLAPDSYHTLKQRIAVRVQQRLADDRLWSEVNWLQQHSYWSWVGKQVIGYQQIAAYLKHQDLSRLQADWLHAEFGYAKRQLVWFKKYFAQAEWHLLHGLQPAQVDFSAVSGD